MKKRNSIKCSTCGLTSKEHPPKPCRRGINPQYLTDKIKQEELEEKGLYTQERKQKRIKYLRALYMSKEIASMRHPKPTKNRPSKKTSTKHAQKRKQSGYKGFTKIQAKKSGQRKVRR